MNLFYYTLILFISFNCFGQKSMHDRWSYELQKHVDENGKVNYEKWGKDLEGLNAYIEILQKFNPKKYWSKNEVLAYWINIYNALTIKLIVENYPINSIKEIPNSWTKNLILINSKSFSLDQIEHEILRKMNEPKIHFAINCASISCPKLLNSAYLPNKLTEQLNIAVKLFLADTTKNIIKEENLLLSKIFFWFKKDFGSRKDLLNFISTYSEIEIKNPKIKYMNYDWELNKSN
ncbi:MAG: hypothetical protein CMC79_00295 [Flavobacteriaceae bacterium]|nr:hypothetical protein [Flavobacteriaceae bacterium]